MLRFLLFVFVVLTNILTITFAQAQKVNVDSALDSAYLKRENYVLNSRDKLTLFLFTSRYMNSTIFTNPGINSNYFPIAPLNIGIGFSHKWLAISISVITPDLAKGKYDSTGKAYENFNLQLLAYTPKYGVDILYGKNIGYFLSNYKSYENVPDAPAESPYFDMVASRLTVNILRIFNPLKYSLNAPMIGGEVQKRNASSFIFNTSFSIANYEMSQPTPTFLLEQMNQDAIFTSGAFYSIGLMPGYGFTWIFKNKFYVGIIPAIGPSIQYKSMTFESGLEERFSISYRFIAKAGIGFHSKKWTTGLTFLLDNEGYHLANESNIISNNGKITFKVGYKINVPKWGAGVSKNMTKAQDKVVNHLPTF